MSKMEMILESTATLKTLCRLDYEKIEKAALDTDRACAMVGCIVSALHDKGGDNMDVKIDDTSCWQVRASLEAVYDILKGTSLVFYETSELIENVVGRDSTS